MAPIEQVEETMAFDVGMLLDAGEGAVVTLVAGDTQLVAHRAVLAARSPVFQAMFRHDTAEAGSGRVTITDVEGPVLRQLLAYCYTLRDPQPPSMVAQLLAAADKYGVAGLKAACEQQLVAQLTVENAAATAVLGVRHSSSNLTSATITFIKAYNFKVLGTQGWADAMRNHAEDLIEVCQLLAEASTKPRLPTASIWSHGDHSQSHTGSSPSTTTHSTSKDDATISDLRRLSTEEKRSRLQVAAREGAVEDLRKLLAAGADMGPSVDGRMSALHWAARGGHVEAVRCLLDAGADICARKRWQFTPLHYAVDSGHAAVVRALAAASADLNARDNYGKTPLHWAAQRGWKEAAAALLEAGADRSSRTNAGETPLDMARQNNQQELIRILT